MSNESQPATAKKAFDTNHSSIPVFFPDEVRIVGGKSLADHRERGPLDTDPPEKPNPLYRPHRLKQPLKEGFVESIDAHGIISAPTILLVDGIPTVETGQSRTRGARVVNYEIRKRLNLLNDKPDRTVAEKCLAAGLPLKSIKFDGKKTRDEINVGGRIIAENHLRVDDNFETVIEQVRWALDATSDDFEMVARMFGLKSGQTIRNWLAFDEKATPEVKAAMAAGRLGLTAASALAAVEDPAEQNAKLAELLSAPDQTVRRAKKIVAEDGGKSANPLPGKRKQEKFLGFINETIETKDDEFMQGVVALLKLQTSGRAGDPRLTKVFKQFEG